MNQFNGILQFYTPTSPRPLNRASIVVVTIMMMIMTKQREVYMSCVELWPGQSITCCMWFKVVVLEVSCSHTQHQTAW